MKILSFQSWHQICSWDEHSLCQHPWAPASPCQQASCKPCGGRSSASGQRIGRHQKQLPERAWVSEISLPHTKSRKRHSIPSESCLPVPQLNSKHRGWAKNWFVVLPQSLCSSRDISTPNQEQNLGWNSLYLHLWEHLCPSTFCPFGVPWAFPSSLREESPLLLQPFTQPALVTSALDDLALPVWKFHVNFMLDWMRKRHRNEWMRQKTELHLKDLIPP